MNQQIHNPEKLMFSIITVSYNCKNTFSMTMDSVVKQSFQNIEYIVVDGQSTDGTAELIKERQSRIDKWVSEPDSGIYDAMNKGVSMASGEWILFLNSGDLLADEQVLEKVADSINNRANLDIVYGNILVEKGGELVVREAKDPQSIHKMYFCHQSAFTKTNLLRKIPFDTNYKMSADLDFFKRCYDEGYTFLKLPLLITIYDLTGISNTNRVAGLQENIQIIKKRDRGQKRIILLFRLYFVVYRIKLTRLFKPSNQ
ncbi:MAG: glycosyltransferase family 2 protein [Bacteroidales bacterium]